MNPVDSRIDLHIHTTASDGTYTPEEIVQWAYQKKLTTIAITDHDGVDGIPAALEASKGKNISVIPGIEISTETKGGVELHILGYYIDIENPQLLGACQRLRKVRKERNQAYLMALKSMGMEITLANMGVKNLDAYMGKPTFARAMVKRGYIQEKNQAFEQIFCKEPLRSIRKKKLSSEEGIALISEAGGIPVLAHPGKTKGLGPKGSQKFFLTMEQTIKELKKYGLKGLECIYPRHTLEETLTFIAMARKQGFIMTQGSDFHGD